MIFSSFFRSVFLKNQSVKISGIQPISNGVSLGYPFIEAILSVLPIVDEFLINDGGSSDETAFYLKKLQKTFPDKIKLFNKPFYPSEHWETIDDCVEFLISQAKGDWIFEVQGDEIWHEKDLLKLKKTIQKADQSNYNSIRSVCYFGAGFDIQANTYKYMNVRIVRKIKGLKSFWGGDDFQTADNRQPAPGFTTSNVPPELIISNTSCYNIGYNAFPNNAVKRTKTTFEFFAKNQIGREKIYRRMKKRKKEEEKNKKKQDFLPRASQNFEHIKEFPALIQGLIGLEKYQVRDELFDKTFLNKLTGLKY